MKISYLEATPRITKRGMELASYLFHDIGVSIDSPEQWSAIQGICSLICRNQKTHRSIQLDYCNNITPISTKLYCNRKELRCEQRIIALVYELARLTGLDLKHVAFEGDPRGETVRICLPGQQYDECNPQYIPIPE